MEIFIKLSLTFAYMSGLYKLLQANTSFSSVTLSGVPVIDTNAKNFPDYIHHTK